MTRLLSLLLALTFATPLSAQSQRQKVVIDVGNSIEAPQGAVLRGLDRINGIYSDFELGTGESFTFERLIVELVECRYPEGQTTTEAFANLRIRDLREELASFEGWMFASSPALSALDHPRYDVWVLRCKT